MVNNRAEIVKILKNSKDPISGERIGIILNISRTGVWKNIKKLIDEGYTIISNHSGYSLLPEEDQLNNYEFSNKIDGYQYLETTESTMDIAYKRIEQGKAINGSVILSSNQKNGRDNNNEGFNSPTGGLYFTLTIFPNSSLTKASDINIYSMTALLSIRDGFRNNMGVETKGVWPFESYIGTKKVGGILLDYRIEGRNIKWINIGIGINIGRKIPRKKMLLTIREELLNRLKEPNNIISEYKRYIDTKENLDQKLESLIDIDKYGTLVIQENNNIKFIYVDDKNRRKNEH